MRALLAGARPWLVGLNKKYLVQLSPEQRRMLLKMVSSGRSSARRITRARILLKADASEGRQPWSDESICAALDVSVATIQRVRQQFAEAGFDAAVNLRMTQRRQEPKLDSEAVALLQVLTYLEPPHGRTRWSPRLLAERLAELGYVDQVSRETVRKVLKSLGGSA